MKRLFPGQTTEEILRQLDRFEEQAYDSVQTVLENHKFEEVFYRVEEARHVGIGKPRLLLRLCLEHLDGSIEGLIGFYRSCNRDDEDLHYEDLISVLLLGFAGAYLAKIAARLGDMTVDALKRYVEDKQEQSEIASCVNEASTEANEVFRVSISTVMWGTLLRDHYRLLDGGALSITELQYAFLLSRRPPGAELEPTDAVLETDELDAVEKHTRFRLEYFGRHSLQAKDPVAELMDQILEDALLRLVDSISSSIEKVDDANG